MSLNYNRGLCHTTTTFSNNKNYLFTLNYVHYKFLKCVKLSLHIPQKQETVQLVVVLIRMMKHPKLVCMQFFSYHDIMCESIRHSCRSFSWTSGSTCIGCWNNNHFYHYVHKVMITLSHTYHTYFIFTDITQRNVNLMTLNK